VNGHTLGAACLDWTDEPVPASEDREQWVKLIVDILAQKAFTAEEVARYQVQRECDQRWFRTLDSHLRLLDRERQKFAAFVDQTDTFVYVTDANGLIRWSNRALGEAAPLEGASGGWIGKSCQDVCDRVGVDCEDCPVAQATADPRVVHRELAPAGGAPGLLYLTALPILGPNGKADETLVTIQNLTGLEGLRQERMRAADSTEEARRALEATEAALRRSEEQLRQAQKMEAIGVLAGGVAHDFNNLLTVIMTQSGLLAKSLLPGSPAAQKAEEIHAASARGAMLTRQLLTFSRNEVLAPKALDLNVVVRELEAMLRGVIGEDVDFSCSPAGSGACVHADKGQVEQVVMNLVVNARDAMPDGGRLQLSVSLETLDEVRARELGTAGPGPYCVISVLDTGTGMDRDTLGRIFEPFFTTKGVGKGTGLGLSTVYGILKQAGGAISVESELGKGSKFRAYLPRLEGADLEGRAAAEGPEPAGGSETILLVEDEPAVRAIGKELLEMNGYNVLEAENGAHALEVADRFPGEIHLLISDVIMPRVGGRELAERLSAIRPSIRVLFVSGFTDDTISRHGVLEEGVAFLQKPFTLEILSQKVRELLDSRQPRPTQGR
jgi:signal transduction histidine kinase/CheY-like chemotaxis protein